MSEGNSIPRRDFIKAGALGSAALMMGGPAFAAAPPQTSVQGTGDALLDGFVAPPFDAKPHTWWHWMDGNVSKAGITADLEAMKRIGLGGAQIFNVAYQIPPGPVKYKTPLWFEMIHHAAAEAGRLGLELGMHNCSGWSSSGGPWITPDHGMQKVVWSETALSGGTAQARLPRPEVGDYGAYYHDIAVLACKTPGDERHSLRDAGATMSTSQADGAAKPLAAGGFPLTFATPDQTLQYIQLSFDTPFAARTLCLDYMSGHGDVCCALQASDDGRTFTTVANCVLHIKGQPSVAFPETVARHFRLVFTGTPLDHTPLVVNGLDLLNGYRLPDWPAKAGFAMMERFVPSWDAPCPAMLAYRHQDIIDVSDHMRPDGTLDWQAPEGDWTVLRFGYAPNGRINTHSEIPEGAGLEVDKMNPKALDAHFAGLIKEIVQDLGPLVGKSFTTLLIDSYEVGPQNWTGAFREEFAKRCGYDITPFLPAFTGRVVDSSETTERVLWDIRHTISDLFAEHYYGHFRTLCRQNGLKAAIEPYTGPYSIMDCGAAADLPMSEFWTGNFLPSNGSRGRRVVSAAHLNGHAIVGAEAFTSAFHADRFTMDPFALKALGDAQFCEGITRFIFHRYAHQPWLGKAPGMTMGPWGMHFERTVTWWEEGADWIGYIARAQYLLQTGAPVADILCFDGEDAQAQSRWGEGTVPEIPKGYDFEFINAAFLLGAKVEDGTIVLANGLRFRVLALPSTRYLTLPIARKLQDLVLAGAKVVGPAPLRSPSYARHGEGDALLRRIVADLWGDCDGKTVTSHGAGRGMVYWGVPLKDVLAALGARPDFAVHDHSVPLLFKHRASPEAEVYFVSHQGQTAAAMDCHFRVTGKAPELWYPDSGRMDRAPVYRETADGVTVPLDLGPSGSVFVIFRRPEQNDHVVAVHPATARIERADGAFVVHAAAAGRYDITTAKGFALRAELPSLPAPMDMSQGWKVSFPPKLGAPPSVILGRLMPLSDHADPGVRYFSGTARYAHVFDVPAALLAAPHEINLDLGEVKNLAEVRINGIRLGLLWKPPFLIPVTQALRPGRNLLEVRVTNLWANRLIGDEQLPDDCEWIAVPDRGMRLKQWPKWFVDNKPRPSKRVAFATWKYFDKTETAPRSGLIGPVTLRVVERLRFA